MPSHFEITITGRQLALLLVAGVALVLVAFGLGAAVGVQHRQAAVTTRPTPLPAQVSPEPALRGVAVPEAPPASSPAPLPTVAAPLQAAATHPTPAVVTPAVSPTSPPTVAPTPSPSVAQAPQGPGSARSGAVAEKSGHWVQVGAFSRRPSADEERKRVLDAGYTPAQVVVELGEDGKYRVRVGPFPDGESAGRVAARLRARGFPGAFTVDE